MRAFRVAVVVMMSSVGCGSAVNLTAKDATPERPSADALRLSKTDHLGRHFDLAETVAAKPTVVIFYRGHW